MMFSDFTCFLLYSYILPSFLTSLSRTSYSLIHYTSPEFRSEKYPPTNNLHQLLLSILPAETTLSLNLEAPRALNTPIIASLPSGNVSRLPSAIRLCIQPTVCTQWFPIFLQHISIEEVALQGVVVASEGIKPALPERSLRVESILSLSERGA